MSTDKPKGKLVITDDTPIEEVIKAFGGSINLDEITVVRGGQEEVRQAMREWASDLTNTIPPVLVYAKDTNDKESE